MTKCSSWIGQELPASQTSSEAPVVDFRSNDWVSNLQFDMALLSFYKERPAKNRNFV